MLTLRLARAGTKKRPVYHLVAADKRARRDGRFVENLGYYIPTRKILVLKQDRVDYWLSVGAQTTETAKELIKRAKKHGNYEAPVKEKYVPKPPKPIEVKKEEKPAEAAKSDAPAAEAPAEVAATEDKPAEEAKAE